MRVFEGYEIYISYFVKEKEVVSFYVIKILIGNLLQVSLFLFLSFFASNANRVLCSLSFFFFFFFPHLLTKNYNYQSMKPYPFFLSRYQGCC